MIQQKILSIASKLLPAETVYAHCDIPCGIYDPHRAIIGALTVIRMIDIIGEAKAHAHDNMEMELAVIRGIHVKEEHAEIVKHEVRVIWGDYFKAEHRSKYTELDGLVHEIMHLASKGKQGMDRDAGTELLNKVNRFAEIFWETKGKETKRVKAPYKPEETIVVPIL